MAGILLLVGCSSSPEEPASDETGEAARFGVSCDPGNTIKINPFHKAFHDTIAYAEGTYGKPKGGYNLYYTFKTFGDCSRHPNKTHCSDAGLCSDAAGRYQFRADTWYEIAGPLGLKSFSPANQEAAISQILLIRGNVDLPDKSPMTRKQFAGVLAKVNDIWASLPGSPYGQPRKTADDLWSQYQKFLPDNGSSKTSSVALTGAEAATGTASAKTATGETRDVGLLSNALRSSEPSARIAAAEALAEHGHPGALTDIASLDLRTDSVAARLIGALGKLAAKATADQRRFVASRLVALLDRDGEAAATPAATLAALGALVRTGEAAATPALQRWLERPNVGGVELAGLVSEIADREPLPGAGFLDMLRARIDRWRPETEFDVGLRQELLADVDGARARAGGARTE